MIVRRGGYCVRILSAVLLLLACGCGVSCTTKSQVVDAVTAQPPKSQVDSVAVQPPKNQIADTVAAQIVMIAALKTWGYKLSESAAIEYAATPGDSNTMWARLIVAAGAAGDPIAQQNKFLRTAKQMFDLDLKTGLMDSEFKIDAKVRQSLRNDPSYIANGTTIRRLARPAAHRSQEQTGRTV